MPESIDGGGPGRNWRKDRTTSGSTLPSQGSKNGAFPGGVALHTPGAGGQSNTTGSKRPSLARRVQLVADPPGYVLQAPDELVDAGRFEQLLEQGKQSLDSDPHEALELFDKALAAWHGDAFAEFAQEDIVYAEAVRLEELRLGCREDRVAAMLRLGRPDEAVSEAEALVTAHPLRERAWSRLMLGLTGGGRPAEALRAAERLRGHLAELGLEPSPAVRELEEAILTEQPEVAWKPETTSFQSPPSRQLVSNLPLELTTFIGRQQELEDLLTLMSQHRLLTLTGVGGVGKSRLHGASANIRERAPLVLVHCQRAELENDLPRLDDHLGREGRERAWQHGLAMSIQDAGRLAVEVMGRPFGNRS